MTATLFDRFLWGCATSSHQIEGDNRLNDWWAWEESGKLRFPSGKACGHWDRFEEDFDLISKLGHNAYRFSVEWSRIEPEPGKWNDAAIERYRQMVEALRRRNIEPVVTLHHFTSPKWFVERGDWLREDAARLFRRFVKKTVMGMGEKVNIWVTINEPMVYLYHGYMLGTWPPGYKDLRQATTALRHLLHAHIYAYREIHQIRQSLWKMNSAVSVSKHMTDYLPATSRWRDRLITGFRRWVANELFVNAAITGFFFYPGAHCELLPGDRTIDYLAVNYYTRNRIRFGGFTADGIMGEVVPTEGAEVNSLGWEVSPEGFYNVLRSLKKYQMPVLITENGICTENDTQRARFIEGHVGAVRKAREDGVPITGYLHWSLLDNFEWDKGFAPRFGIVHVDFNTLERKVKDSAHVLSSLCRQLAHGESIPAG